MSLLAAMLWRPDVVRNVESQGSKTSTLFFSLSTRAALRPRPARRVRQRRGRAARSAACNTFCGNLEKQVGQVQDLLFVVVCFWQSKTLRAAQTRDHGLTTRICVSSTHVNEAISTHLLTCYCTQAATFTIADVRG